MNIHTKFDSNWPCGFREEDQNQTIPSGSFFGFSIDKMKINYYRTIQWIFLQSFDSNWPLWFQRRPKSDNTLWILFVFSIDKMKRLIITEPSNEHSYKVLIQLIQWFQRRLKTYNFLTALGLVSFVYLRSIRKAQTLERTIQWTFLANLVPVG